MDNIKEFFEKLNSDENLQTRVKNELEGLEDDAKIEKIIEIAKGLGFNFSEKDFTEAKTELSEDDLDKVNGGFFLTAIGLGFLVYKLTRKNNPAPAPNPTPESNPSGDNNTTEGEPGNTINQTNNTNNQGIQGNQQGGSGTQKNVQGVNSGGGNVSF